MNRRGFLRAIGGLGLLALSPIKAPAAPVHTGVDILTGAANWDWDAATYMAGPLTLADLQRFKKTVLVGSCKPNIIVMSRREYRLIRSKLESWYYAESRVEGP